MAATEEYPFQLKDIILKSLSVNREGRISDVVEVNVAAGMRVADAAYPRFEIVLKMETQGESKDLTFDLELVGVFELADGTTAPDRQVVLNFATERALFILWAYADQIIRFTTGQMGVNPIKLPPPHSFLLGSPSLSPSASASPSPDPQDEN